MVKKWIESRTAHERWGLHVGILLIPIFYCVMRDDLDMARLMPDSFLKLGYFVVQRLCLVAIFFGLAFLISEVAAEELYIRRVKVFRTGLIALGWSLLLRIPIYVALFIPLFTSIFLFKTHLLESYAHRYGMHMYKIFFHERYVQYPFEAATILITASCMAGLAEELWRAGMFAGLSRLYPRLFSGRWGSFGMIVSVAVVFACAHVYQGAIGIGMTFLLGIGLGCVLLYRKSFWEAAITHALFDAASFLMFLGLMVTHHTV